MKQKKKRATAVKEHNIRIRELSDSLKRNNIQIIGVSEDQERKRGRRFVWKIIVENFPNLGKDTDIKIQEAQRTRIRFNKN